MPFRRRKQQRSGKQWARWWSARQKAIEKVLGSMDDVVRHATIPFEVGYKLGGAADVVSFSKGLDGIAYVTADLIGNEKQIPNQLGSYELMICHRTQSDWGPDTISRLAYYTLHTPLNPGETMDIGPTAPQESTVVAFLFLEYASFKVRGRQAGLLLCIGITKDELDVRFAQGPSFVEQKLKDRGVYPYTDLTRSSVLA